MSKYVWSDTLGTLIPRGFYTRKVVFKNDGSKPYRIAREFHWTWNEDDAVYYRDDVDDTFTYEVFKNGLKTYVLEVGSHARYLVKIG